MGYKTKQILNMRAKLHLIVYILDLDGNHSYQLGTADGIPSEEHDIMGERAVLNAVYKHLNLNGMNYAKGGSYDYKEMSRMVQIEDYWFTYSSEGSIYSMKTITRNHKRYNEIRRRGKIYSRTRFTYDKNLYEDYEV